MLSIRSYLHNPFLVGIALVSLILNGALWVYLTAHLSPQEETVPVHYNIYFGIDLLGPWWYPLLLPAVGAAVFLVNLLLSVILYDRERLASYFLVLASCTVQIFTLLTGYFVITQL